MGAVDGHISVMTFAESSESRAKATLRKQLRDMASQNGVRLVGSPSYKLQEALGLWGGEAKQNYKES